MEGADVAFPKQETFVTKPLKRKPKPKTVKVAICIPVYGDPKCKFMHSLMNLLIYSLSHATLTVDGEERLLELNTFTVNCSMLTESRHTLVAAAMARISHTYRRSSA